MDELKEILEKSYDIEVLDIEKIKNAYKVSTRDGLKCYKSSHYDLGQFNFIVGFIEHLHNNGFNGILPIYNTKSGERYIKDRRGFGFLCDWIDSREANFKNPVELKMCIDTLSSLHRASRGYSPKEHIKGRVNYGRWIKKFEKRCDELLYFKALISAKEKVSEFDSIYNRYFDVYYRQALKAIGDIKNSDYMSVMEEHKKLHEACHHDTANHNFLVTPDLKMYMIDFDYCIQDSHLHDLASIIIRNLKYGNWYMDVMEYIINCYSNNISIDNKEIYIMFCFMEFPQDFWQVGLQYYVEKQPWGEDFFVRKLNRIVKDNRDRVQFLNELEADLKDVYLMV